MERIPTKIIIEKGQVFTTDKPMPVEPPNQKEVDAEYASVMVDFEAALESWKKEALVVWNPEILVASKENTISRPSDTDSDVTLHTNYSFNKPTQDGIYDCPDGLVFEVKDELRNGADHDGQQCEYTMCYSGDHKIKDKCLGWCNKVAILSFKEPSKETERCPHCNGSGGVKIGEFEYDTCPCVATKEPSSERPDYFKLSRNDYGKGFLYYMPDGTGRFKCWMPLDEELYVAIENEREKIQSLEQEVERLREELKSKQ